MISNWIYWKKHLLNLSIVLTSGFGFLSRKETGRMQAVLHINVCGFLCLPVVEDAQSGIKMWQDDENEKVKKAHGKGTNRNAYLS